MAGKDIPYLTGFDFSFYMLGSPRIFPISLRLFLDFACLLHLYIRGVVIHLPICLSAFLFRLHQYEAIEEEPSIDYREIQLNHEGEKYTHRSITPSRLSHSPPS